MPKDIPLSSSFVTVTSCSSETASESSALVSASGRAKRSRSSSATRRMTITMHRLQSRNAAIRRRSRVLEKMTRKWKRANLTSKNIGHYVANWVPLAPTGKACVGQHMPTLMLCVRCSDDVKEKTKQNKKNHGVYTQVALQI